METDDDLLLSLLLETLAASRAEAECRRRVGRRGLATARVATRKTAQDLAETLAARLESPEKG